MAKICLAPKFTGLLLVQRKICCHTSAYIQLKLLKVLKIYNSCLNISMDKYRRTGLFQRSHGHQIIFLSRTGKTASSRRRVHSIKQNFVLTVVGCGCEEKASCPNSDAMCSGSPNQAVSSPFPLQKASTMAPLAYLSQWISQVETWYCNRR
jgi:hypothetical protein